MHDYSDLRRILLEVLVIIALGVVMGLSANIKLVSQVLQGRTPTAKTIEPAVDPAAPSPVPRPIDLESMQKGIADGSLLILDARISELYTEGHLPGAVSLPLDEVDSRLADFITATPFTRKLATYCNGYGCPDSYDLAVKLLAAGYLNVQVYEGGFPEWQDAGQDIERGRMP